MPDPDLCRDPRCGHEGSEHYFDESRKVIFCQSCWFRADDSDEHPHTPEPVAAKEGG